MKLHLPAKLHPRREESGGNGPIEESQKREEAGLLGGGAWGERRGQAEEAEPAADERARGGGSRCRSRSQLQSVRSAVPEPCWERCRLRAAPRCWRVKGKKRAAAAASPCLSLPGQPAGGGIFSIRPACLPLQPRSGAKSSPSRRFSGAPWEPLPVGGEDTPALAHRGHPKSGGGGGIQPPRAVSETSGPA